MKTNSAISRIVATTLAGTVLMTGAALTVAEEAAATQSKPINVQIGTDLNSADNPFVQPQDAALAGNGRDQSLQFGDVLRGTLFDDLQIGRLGTDVLASGRGDDVILGGLEHFNPLNRDRAFGGSGRDIFIWKPGDGSDLFEGGSGFDAVVFGVVGEIVDGQVAFAVSQDQQAGEVAINPDTYLPLVDVSGSPGFCEVIDESFSHDAAAALDELNLDDLVRFSIRGIRDAFESGQQTEDNGLRVTLHLKSVEYLVCTNRSGGEIEVVDLTSTPAQRISLDDIKSRTLRHRLAQIVF